MPPPYCVAPSQGIPLNYFATSSQLAALAATVAANGNSRIDSAFVAIDALNAQTASLRAQADRSLQYNAIAAAMKDAIPNTGDRFAIRLNAAGFDGYAAAAVGFSYNITDRARVSINYGQSRSQNIVSGGMNFSFH